MANQTVRVDLGTKGGVKSMWIGFTEQRLTAHGGLAVWTRLITERGLREPLQEVLPHAPTSPNAYDPCDTAPSAVAARRSRFRVCTAGP